MLLKAIFIGSILAIIFSLVGIHIILPMIEEANLSEFRENILGAWESDTGNITITFFSNGTCIAINHNKTYIEPWEITRRNHIRLNWEGVRGTYSTFFLDNGTELRLLGVYESEGTTFVSLTKQ